MNLDALNGLGRAPVSEAAPSGADVRDDPRFDALQAELAKLATPGADGQTDWQRVAELAAQLLSTQGKDLLVASYLAAALLQSDDLAGLAVGLEVLADLVEHHWEGMGPPVARLRGRRNAVQWLLDRIDRAAEESPWSERAPQPPELVECLRTQAARIDDQLRARDDEAPSLRGLRQWVDSLPVREPPPPPAEPPAEGEGGSRAATAAGLSMPALAAPDGDLDAALVHAFDHLNQLADLLMAADLSDARAYRTSRFAQWAGVQALPPASGGQTQIPPPIAQVADALRNMRDGALDPADAIRFAEAQLPAFPFWLDLQQLCASALASLGDSHAAARAEVEGSTRQLLTRLPGIEALSFASGMPFADGDTVQWLGTLVVAGDGVTEPAGGGGTRGADKAVAQARSLAANGEVEAAAALMQQAIDRAPDAAAALRARIQLASLLAAHGAGRVPAAFAQVIVAQLRRHELDVWDPALAAEGWAAAYEVLRDDEARADEAEAALAGLAALDAARALRLRAGA